MLQATCAECGIIFDVFTIGPGMPGMIQSTHSPAKRQERGQDHNAVHAKCVVRREARETKNDNKVECPHENAAVDKALKQVAVR